MHGYLIIVQLIVLVSCERSSALPFELGCLLRGMMIASKKDTRKSKN